MAPSIENYTPPEHATVIYEIKRVDVIFYFCVGNELLQLELNREHHPWYLDFLDLFEQDKIYIGPHTRQSRVKDEQRWEDRDIIQRDYTRTYGELTNFRWAGAFLKSKHPNVNPRCSVWSFLRDFHEIRLYTRKESLST